MESQRTLLEPLRRLDPTRIGSYVLLGRLGAGAMGRVYLGRSAAGRLVAVKTIKLEFAEEDDFRARFAQEVAAARRVNGVFTAGVVAADPDADVPWLATAYVPAPSLDRLVRTCGPLPVPAVRWLAAGCAEALASIHDAGLVHRDLKPSNVLVAPDGPRVIDFGVARAAEPIDLTSTHGSVGTPAYMAPEQARDTRQATAASDVFSLGSTLLFAASGHAPYRGQTATDILIRLATEPPDLSGLPAELAGIVTGCLDRDPRRRPTSAALLGKLAPYVNAATGPGFGSSLPESALGLIEEYRHGPPPAGAAGEAGEATIGSVVSLPERGPVLAAPAAGGTGRHDGAAGRVRGLIFRAAGPGRRRGRRIATVAALGAGVIGLAVLGSLLGASINGDSGGNTDDSSAPGRGPAFGPPPPPLPGAVPGTTISGPAGGGKGHQQITLNQGRGDGYTVFVVHGNSWPPGQRITVRLAGRVSRDGPVVDLAGTFSYAINQAHEFFGGKIPPGSYTVVLTASGGEASEVSFHVGLPLNRR
jgi:Protein kinase domain